MKQNFTKHRSRPRLSINRPPPLVRQESTNTTYSPVSPYSFNEYHTPLPRNPTMTRQYVPVYNADLVHSSGSNSSYSPEVHPYIHEFDLPKKQAWV